MTTHLRARAVQAGALLALVGGMLAVASSPALAKDPDVQIQNVQSRDLPSGGKTALTFTVTNGNQGAPTPISVNVNGNGFSCSGDCSPQALFNPNDTKTFNIQLTAPTVDAGQTRTIQVQITANGPGGDTGQASQQFTVRGADKPRTVRQVTGRVKDQDGKSVPGANVGMKDSQGHTFVSISNDEGRFQFTSSDQNPIVPGNLTVGAAKDGYEGATVNVQGGADKTVNVPLTLQAKEASASASPSATAAASPTAAAAADPASEEASAPPATDTQNAAQNNGGGSSMLFIILGALLVAAGIGAIVLLLMRRRGNKGDGPDDPDGMGGGPGGPVPPSQGRYNGLPDSTRVAAPVGGRANDATMVARSGSAISDAPTMMQQAVPLDDEFPDPYGAPAVPGGGYAGAGGYGAAAAGPYGGATQYGAGGAYGGAQVPAQSGGYDAGPATQYGRPPVPDEDPYGAYAPPSGGGYGGAVDQPRYDEPTGMYRPEYGAADGGQDDGYGYGGGDRYAAPEPEYPRGGGQATSAYQGGGGGGYGGGQEPQDGYGQWGAPAGGIDNGNAYGAPAGGGSYGGGGYGAASYGQPAGGSYGGGRGEDGYDDAGQGGYDQRGAYGGGRPSDAYDRGYEQQGGGGYGGADQYGRGDQAGYYGGQDQARGDQAGGGRHGGGQSRADSSHPGQRRPLDWLDD